MLSHIRKWFGIEKKAEEAKSCSLPVMEVSIEEVKRAVAKFAKEKPQGVLLNVLIKDNLEVDYQLLAPYLQAIPIQTYYMSRETYEVFEDQVFARMIDLIQRAVDLYIDGEGKFPVVDHDPEMKISYYKLHEYLKEQPTFDTYLTPDENLITWKKPTLH